MGSLCCKIHHSNPETGRNKVYYSSESPCYYLYESICSSIRAMMLIRIVIGDDFLSLYLANYLFSNALVKDPQFLE